MKNQYIVILFFLIGLIIFNMWMIITGAQPWIISSLNIFFHEAGHWVFGFFGEFIGVLGGTLGELFMPGIFIVYFWLQQDIAGKAFSSWWLSTSLYNISIYVSDAQLQKLDLIGGPGGHDWFYLLGRIRLLDYDIFFGKIFVLLSALVTCYIVVLVYQYWNAIREKILL